MIVLGLGCTIMDKKFLIFTPSYNENSGGIVVLHKLCHVLNELGYESYLKPYSYSYEVKKGNWKLFIWRLLKWSLLASIRCFKTNPAFNTPVLKDDTVDDDWIVIYPEVVFGNPLNAKNVVRWLLHQPGFHEGHFFYGKNELYFKFNSAIDDFHFHGSVTSSNELKVIHYPLEHYNFDGVAPERVGTAYCLRKGRNKKIVHDVTDSILIDGKSHAEVARIFKKVKRFISYDTYTAYSIFAVLCGCQSVVIPDDGVSIDEWYPNETDRYGIAYGFQNIEEASKTACLVREHVRREEGKVKANVAGFAEEAIRYFL
jgi:hypothetical protein